MLVSASGRRFRLPTPCGGDEEDRTPDPLLARQVLSQLSYTPIVGPCFEGLDSLECFPSLMGSYSFCFLFVCLM